MQEHRLLGFGGILQQVCGHMACLYRYGCCKCHLLLPSSCSDLPFKTVAVFMWIMDFRNMGSRVRTRYVAMVALVAC
jgi:hypothetical protein